MKRIEWMLSFGLMLLALFVANVYAASPREQFKQMVEQLQKSPSDSALREKIIKLAQTLKPAPAVPEEAERRMARGTAAFKGAKSTADYQEAAREFEQATLAAPWYGDAYYNLGVAQDKAEQYEVALRSLKLAQLASPDAKEIKALIYEVEYRNEKSNSPEGLLERFLNKARQSQQQFAGLIRELDAKVFISAYQDKDGVLHKREMRFYKEGEGHFLGCLDPDVEGLLGGSRWVVPTSEREFECGSYGSFRLSANSSVLYKLYGNEVLRTYQRQ